jgi:hypothetical protein
MTSKLLLAAALVCAGILSAHAQSTNAPNNKPTNAKAPTQEQAAEMMKIINEALTKNGFQAYKITAVAARSADDAAGSAKTGTVPPECYVWESPIGTFTYCR